MRSFDSPSASSGSLRISLADSLSAAPRSRPQSSSTSAMGTPATIALPDWSTRLLNELDDNDLRARELVTPLNAEQLNWRSAEGTWSIGQCLEHLCATNDVYPSPIIAALEGKP